MNNNVNEEIEYKFPFYWSTDGLPGQPKVNPLIRAMCEANLNSMEQLFASGASIGVLIEDEEYCRTFQRVLYEVMGNYDIINSLVSHGFTNLFFKISNYATYGKPFEYGECLNGAGYRWSMLARAWTLQAYDVMELLAKNSFINISKYNLEGLYDYNNKMNLIDEIFKNNDIRAAKILLENGYDRKEFDNIAKQYVSSEIVKFLDDNPVVRQTSIALEYERLDTLKKPIKPQLEKESMLFKKSTQKRNQRRMYIYDLMLKEYDNRIELQNKLLRIYKGETSM